MNTQTPVCQHPIPLLIPSAILREFGDENQLIAPEEQTGIRGIERDSLPSLRVTSGRAAKSSVQIEGGETVWFVAVETLYITIGEPVRMPLTSLLIGTAQKLRMESRTSKTSYHEFFGLDPFCHIGFRERSISLHDQCSRHVSMLDPNRVKDEEARLVLRVINRISELAHGKSA